MTWDAQNFNTNVEGELADRLHRLIEEITPLAQGHDFEAIHRDLFKTPASPSFAPRPAEQIAAAVAAGIYGRLREVARARRPEPDQRSNHADLFELRAVLDEEENEWRASLGLPPVSSEDE
ncbi:MAG TPA: hypothetical protein VGQ36_14570 [Thermoanaerobaculia bacterium]|jgi:hypothetical protein|nr:hypothetical protein [Thermoanaerobaculia bacterium]